MSDGLDLGRDAPQRDAIVAVMGATGTGKSTFIKLLTGDPNIVIGHDPESQTAEVGTHFYLNPQSGLFATLVDTPGFDDSRDGVTDTDILEKIVQFLQSEGGQKLNGIVYMYPISNVRANGMAKKNLRMFKELCGTSTLSNVLIVTTHWNCVKEDEGIEREAKLASGVFKGLIEGGARMVRQDKGLESARFILSQLVFKNPVKTQIQEELEDNRALGDTSAGAVITQEMKILMEKHEKDMAALKIEMEAESTKKNEALKAELAEERQVLEREIARAARDQERLQEKFEEERLKVEEVARVAKKQADRGILSKFMEDYGEVMEKCMDKGTEEFGVAGTIGGAIVGMYGAAPLVAAKRVLFGR